MNVKCSEDCRIKCHYIRDILISYGALRPCDIKEDIVLKLFDCAMLPVIKLKRIDDILGINIDKSKVSIKENKRVIMDDSSKCEIQHESVEEEYRTGDESPEMNIEQSSSPEATDQDQHQSNISSSGSESDDIENQMLWERTSIDETKAATKCFASVSRENKQVHISRKTKDSTVTKNFGDDQNNEELDAAEIRQTGHEIVLENNINQKDFAFTMEESPLDLSSNGLKPLDLSVASRGNNETSNSIQMNINENSKATAYLTPPDSPQPKFSDSIGLQSKPLLLELYETSHTSVAAPHKLHQLSRANLRHHNQEPLQLQSAACEKDTNRYAEFSTSRNFRNIGKTLGNRTETDTSPSLEKLSNMTTDSKWLTLSKSQTQTSSTSSKNLPPLRNTSSRNNSLVASLILNEKSNYINMHSFKTLDHLLMVQSYTPMQNPSSQLLQVAETPNQNTGLNLQLNGSNESGPPSTWPFALPKTQQKGTIEGWSSDGKNEPINQQASPPSNVMDIHRPKFFVPKTCTVVTTQQHYSTDNAQGSSELKQMLVDHQRSMLFKASATATKDSNEQGNDSTGASNYSPFRSTVAEPSIPSTSQSHKNKGTRKWSKRKGVKDAGVTAKKKNLPDDIIPSDAYVPGKCAACGKMANFLCTGCRKTVYCGPRCQLITWWFHKDVCAHSS